MDMQTPIVPPSILAGRCEPGMSFQQKVWAITARIPPGKVATYADLARQLGTNAYRAVGQAMHHNPYAPTIPCHRVVGSDGKLTGYARGLEKKTAMLQNEGVQVRSGKVDLARYRCTWHQSPKCQSGA